MKNNISIVVITADSWRHRYLANKLAESFNVIGVVSEKKRLLNSGKTEKENSIITQHVLEREKKEKEFFGNEVKFNIPKEKILSIPYGDVNSDMVFNWVCKLNPDYIALYGTGIIKNPLLETFSGKIINMHLGLSPYYRGTGTNFWPLVFNQPELVGVTVHLAVKKVDAGSILGQIRPDDININDGSHDIGNKAIVKGVELLIFCIKSYFEGKLTPKPQKLDIGKVFKHTDFNSEFVLKMKDNFKNGMISRYLKDKNKRDAVYPIIYVMK